jgi:hypothetical protein
VSSATLVASAQAQTLPSGLAQVLLALDDGPDGPARRVDGRLFGAVIDATIFDQNQDFSDFDDADLVQFTITSRDGSERLTFAEDISTRAAFEDWARRHAPEILAILFPESLSAAVLGRDSGQLFSQQFLLSTVLGSTSVREPGTPRRFLAGGLVEFEWTRLDGEDSSWAWQGLWGAGRFASIQARYARTREDLTTDAWGVTFDYHPYMEFGRDVTVRVGATARTGFVYARSELTGASQALDLGTIDFGGGGWTSVRKDFQRVRVAGGLLLQGTKSFVPVIDDEAFGFLAGIINGRPVSWDVAYGGTVAFDTSLTTAVIVKYLESRSPWDVEFDRPPLHVALFGYSFTLAPGASMDVGYKHTSTRGVRSGSVFLQGNFGW